MSILKFKEIEMEWFIKYSATLLYILAWTDIDRHLIKMLPSSVHNTYRDA